MKMSSNICLYETFKGSAEDMAAAKTRCAMDGCPSCQSNGEIIMTATGSVQQCKKCGAEAITLIDGVCNTCLSKEDNNDVIDWPKHYNTGKIQPIDAIEDWKLDFRLANAVKYIARCEHKGKKKQDLEKAVWYIQRYLDKECKNK